VTVGDSASEGGTDGSGEEAGDSVTEAAMDCSAEEVGDSVNDLAADGSADESGDSMDCPVDEIQIYGPRFGRCIRYRPILSIHSVHSL
jgi:hypothetical protein